MRNIKLTLAYDGTDFNGWQVQSKQPHVRTVQATLEEKLSLITKEPVRVVAAGRTDAGVHALGQVVSFVTSSTIPTERFPQALNSVLPDDLVIRNASEVNSNFHARYSAISKTYRYTFYCDAVPDVLWRRYAYHVKQPLDFAAMQEAVKLFQGTHNFSSFCASGSSVKTFVRTVLDCRLTSEGKFSHLLITADGFLYNMVRIIMGTLLEVGKGKMDPHQIKNIINAQDRESAGPTAPPHGLCLVSVQYPSGH